ncbi:GNAT family N-acetyltransferase [Collinsella phocaeensis]|uniref:GNAT family N-acetyltransferase n=1 Tax=Collinsella phocaeensis TaxID=1871016 RepID=UPI000931D88D|nr:GNAT family N-acetyltransferase [Collinsella phocaeensis]
MTASFSRPVQLAAGEGIEGFHCSVEIVDSWATRHAATARARGTAVVYVSRCAGRVVGFYTLSTHSVMRSAVGGGWLARNAPSQVPAVLLGMLGVDDDFKGMGLGAALLRDAIINASKVAAIASARALVVDPADDSAAAFYTRFGFRHIGESGRMAIRL